MAYKINWEELNKTRTNAPKKSTGVRTVAKAPAKSSAARNAYVKTLGFTPKDMPEFRSDRGKMSGISKAFDILDRPASGLRNVTMQRVNQEVKDRKSGKSGAAVAARKFFESLPPVTIAKYGDDFFKGMTGDTNVTGRSLVSRVADDPYIRKDFSPTTKKILDNNVVRSGLGLGIDIAGDPTNAVPIGVALKPFKKVSKVVGLTDNVLNPASKAIKSSHAVKGIVKTLGGGRTEVWKAATSNSDTTKAMFSEVADLSNKMVKGALKPREATALKALVRGVGDRIGDKKGAELFLKTFDNTLKTGQDAVERVVKSSGKVDVKKLDEYIRGIPQDVIDADYLAIAKMGREPIEYMGKQLVRTGQLAQETLDENLNYMAKFYTNQGSEKLANQFGSSAGSRGLGAEAGRLEEAINEPSRVIEYLRENRVKLPEVKEIMKKYRKEIGKYDPKDVTARNELAKKLEPELRKTLGDNFSRFAYQQQKGAGLITDAPTVLANTLEQQGDIIAKTQLFEAAKPTIKDFADEAMAAQEGFKRIPKTPKYQDLGGRFVPDVIYDDIVGIVDPGNGIMKQAVNNWKKLKLFSPFNFAPNSRNFISDLAANSVVEDGAPVAMQLAMMPKLVQDYWNGGKYMKLLTEKGVFADTFASQEIRKTLGRQLGQPQRGGLMDLTTRATNKFTSKSFNSKIPALGFGTEAYGYTSDIGKMTQIAYQMEKKGKTIDEAIKVAEKATFNYSKLPVSLRKYRDNLMPFMTYKYFATQLVWDTLINRTGKISKLNHIRRNVEGLSADKANDRDLPQYMKDNRPFYMRMPGAFNDEKDNPRYLDASYLLPMGDVGGTSATDLVFGNPFLKTAIEFGTNKSMFNQQPIVQDTDTMSEKAKKRALYLLSQFGPSAPYMPNAQGDIKLIDAAKGRENSMGNKMDLRYEAPARLAGIRMNDIDPKTQKKYNSYDNKDKITELKGKIKKVKKDKSMSDKKKEKMINQYKEQIRLIKEY